MLVSLGTPAGRTHTGYVDCRRSWALDGTVKPVKGILPIVRKAKQEGHKRCIVPLENAKEGAIIKDIQVIGVRSLQETIDYLILQEKDKASFLVPAEYDNDTDTGEDSYDVDFADINGQETVKRAMEVAAAGFHHILMMMDCREPVKR